MFARYNGTGGSNFPHLMPIQETSHDSLQGLKYNFLMWCPSERRNRIFYIGLTGEKTYCSCWHCRPCRRRAVHVVTVQQWVFVGNLFTAGAHNIKEWIRYKTSINYYKTIGEHAQKSYIPAITVLLKSMCETIVKQNIFIQIKNSATAGNYKRVILRIYFSINPYRLVRLSFQLQFVPTRCCLNFKWVVIF